MTPCSNAQEQTRLIHGDCRDPLQQTPGPPIQRGSTVLLPTCEALYDGSKVTYGRVGLSTQRTLRNALREHRNTFTLGNGRTYVIDLGAEDPAEAADRPTEVVALLGRHAGTATRPEASTPRVTTCGGQDFLIVLVSILLVAHATAPSPSWEATISAYVGQVSISS